MTPTANNTAVGKCGAGGTRGLKLKPRAEARGELREAEKDSGQVMRVVGVVAVRDDGVVTQRK